MAGISQSLLAKRIAKTQAFVQKSRCGALVIPALTQTDSEHPFFYFTNETSESSILIIPAKGRATLFVAGFTFQQLNRSILSQVYDVRVLNGLQDKKLLRFVKGKTLACDGSTLSYRAATVLKKLWNSNFIDVSQGLVKITTALDDYELGKVQRACTIMSRIMQKTIAYVKHCKYEQDIYDYLSDQAHKNKVTFSFPPIIASGKNASTVHYHNTKSSKIERGFLIIDAGVKYEGYCSDMTRTIYLGTPTKKEIDAYNIVLRAQQASEKAATFGCSGKQIDEASRKIIGGRLIHAVGHGLGRAVHQYPSISARGEEKIAIGTVFTIEPGMYEAGKFGIRIEDDYVMTKKGAKRLTGGSTVLKIIGLKN